MNSDNRHQRLSESPDQRIRVLARRQLAVFTYDQAILVGLSPYALSRRVRSGEFERLHRGVFRLSGIPDSWEQRLLAACLLTKGIASHRSAALLLELDGVARAPIEVSVVGKGRKSRHPILLHNTQDLSPWDVSSLGPIPITTGARTLIDLGAVVDRETVERALEDALKRRLTSETQLSSRIRELEAKGRSGVGVIKSILDERGSGPPVESFLELKFLKILKSSGLQLPIKQYEIFDTGRFVARVDFAYPVQKIIIEVDGFAYHSSPRELDRDRSRRNELTSLGWRVFQITWRQIQADPVGVIERLRKLLLDFDSR